MIDLLEKLNKVADPLKKAEIMTNIFGKEYQDDIAKMLNALPKLNENLAVMRDRAKLAAGGVRIQFGQNLDKDVSKIDRATQAIDVLYKRVGDPIKVQVGGVAEQINAFVDRLEEGDTTLARIIKRLQGPKGDNEAKPEPERNYIGEESTAILQQPDPATETAILRMLTAAPAETPAPAAQAAHPELVALVEAWQAAERKLENAALSEEQTTVIAREASGLQRAIYAFPSSSPADLCAKLPALCDEAGAAAGTADLTAPYPTLDACCLRGLVADLERLSTGMEADAPSGCSPDPVAIETATGPDADLLALGRDFDAAFAAYLAVRRGNPGRLRRRQRNGRPDPAISCRRHSELPRQAEARPRTYRGGDAAARHGRQGVDGRRTAHRVPGRRAPEVRAQRRPADRPQWHPQRAHRSHRG